MMHAQAYMAVLLAACSELVIGMLWYSNHLFGSIWQKNGGKMPAQSELYRNLGLQAISALFTASALFIAMSIFQKTQTGVYAKDGFLKIFSLFLEDDTQNNNLMSAVKTAGFIWLGFLAPAKACQTIWGSGNWKKFAIETIGQLTSLISMAVVIASLS